MTKYYKVVQNINGRLHSAIHSSIGPEYIPGEWVEPLIEGTQLMVFSDLNSAMCFSGSSINLIWECEIEKFNGVPIFLYNYNLLTFNVEKFLNKILNLKRKREKFSHLTDYKKAPENSVFCKRVKLIKRVFYA